MKKKMCVRQRDRSDCGAACIASIGAFYGQDVSVARIREYAATNVQGTTVSGILEAMGRLGMNAKAVRAEAGLLAQLPLPAIAHTHAGEIGHYVVLVQVGTRHITVMDPAEGRFRKLKADAFLRTWTGVLVLITPGPDPQPLVPKRTGRRLMELVLPERRLLLISLLAAILVSVLGLSTSLYLQQLIDIALARNNNGLLNLFSVLMIGLVLVQLSFSIIRDLLSLQCSRRISSRMILTYYDHLLHLPQSFFDRMQVGEIMSRINDAVRISVFINEVGIGIVLNLLTLVFSLALMFIQRWELALLVVGALPVYLVLFWINDRLSRTWQRRLMVAGAAFDAQLAETLVAADTLKKLSLETDAYRKTAGKLATVLDTAYQFSIRQVGIQHSADLGSRLLTIGLLWTGCYFVMDAQLTRGELFAFFALTGYLTTPLLELLNAGKQIRDAQIAAERLFEVLALDREHSGSIPIPETHGADIAGVDIMLSGVSFGYGDRKPVLCGVNLCIPAGSFIGITGKSGAGKSTFAALLQKIYLPLEGVIRVNGTDIRELDNRSLRSRVVAVPQHTDLFSGSLAANIAIGTSGIDIDRIHDICSRLGMPDFAVELPNGLNAAPPGAGHGLSGGERQRLAIARALYRQPAVLILDEATSALDVRAEQEVMQTIEWFNKRGGTVIVIAHRAPVLAACRQVYTLENCILQ